VALVAAGIQLSRDVRWQGSALNSGDEAMLGVVAMVILAEAVDAKIEVFTRGAVEEVRLGQLLHAAIASASVGRSCLDWERSHRNLVERRRSRLDDGLGAGGHLLNLGLRRNLLRRARDKDAVSLESLNKPVVATIACDPAVHASQAQVEVVIVTLSAMVVRVRNGLLAVVAANAILSPGRGWSAGLSLELDLGRLIEPASV
jgi:hypothetical protein